MKGWTSKQKKEESVQIAVCDYLKRVYPSVIFTAESSGIRLTIGQAVKSKRQRSHRGLPDLMILEPRGLYHGLMIELKGEGKSPYKRNGELKSDNHIAEQESVHLRLRKLGYFACFATGIGSAKMVIDKYMSQ